DSGGTIARRGHPGKRQWNAPPGCNRFNRIARRGPVTCAKPQRCGVTVRFYATVRQRCGTLSEFTPACCHPRLSVLPGQYLLSSVRHLILQVTADHSQLSVV